ncbi:hypothetical protein [Sphingomonas sp.]|uniref:hypothetical protein n=1 Tax=Sphingomonas sp. TaxID=28214 RepID=UPI00257B87FC|nr:hypothetical protein [Sphingomonas sp.]
MDDITRKRWNDPEAKANEFRPMTAIDAARDRISDPEMPAIRAALVVLIKENGTTAMYRAGSVTNVEGAGAFFTAAHWLAGNELGA